MSRYASLFTGSSTEGTPAEKAGAVRYRILLVDDEPNVLSALRRIFRQENYQITTAGNGQDALELLRRESFHLMISDYMMPVMNGGDLLRQAKTLHPDMIRIMLTGHADTGAVMAAINEGAVYKFILKPWDDDDLRVTVALALEQYELIRKNRALSQENAQKAKDIAALSKLAVTNRSRAAAAAAASSSPGLWRSRLRVRPIRGSVRRVKPSNADLTIARGTSHAKDRSG